jgi:uncharacterized protein (DUF1015 family)
MATICPFRALRYDPARVRVGEAVTQPYDKITPEMRRRYYAASPYNLVRIILGDPETEGGDVYEAAAAQFRDWRNAGVLRPDPEPSLYIYAQRFTLPGGHEWQQRRGFIALGRLHDYSEGVVFRHEQTLAKPKADRLQLLRATRAHFGQLFMLYSDPRRALDPLLAPASAPDVDVTDEYGVQHRVWRISDLAAIESVQQFMAERKLIIADGHHRYETALAYRSELNECHPERGGGSMPPPSRRTSAVGSAPHDFAMMTFVNMDAPGLVILPTHRVIHGLAGFDRDLFLRSAFPYFTVEKAPADTLSALCAAGKTGTAFVAAMGSEAYLLRARPGAADAVLAAVSPCQRLLDVVQLHKVLLEHVLGLSEESIRQQQNLAYVRDAADAMAQARAGANVALLMNPVRMEQVRDVALAGEVLPQKSTDFYPKMLSGLTIYALE